MSSTQGVVILGSTGSIGLSTLDVLAAFPDRFRVVGLAANSDASSLQEQVDIYHPNYIALSSHQGPSPTGAKLIDSDDPLLDLVMLGDADIVVVATTGHAAIPATIAALEAGKIVALANKETIVAAGSIVIPVARKHPGNLRPVDSEHSAIWQCLPREGVKTREVERILLTASGGPFRGFSASDLENVDVDQALAHPTWTMGNRITIDSATLMNKGLELIEAAWLFDCPIDQIEIVLHPQSIVHSMVEYADGSVIAQLASHDMRLPIQYALTYPERLNGPAEKLNLREIATLEFDEPDYCTFRAPLLAKQAHQMGATFPAVLSTADELAVGAFLSKKIRFTDIVPVVERALDAHVAASGELTLEQIEAADIWTKRFISDALNKIAT